MIYDYIDEMELSKYETRELWEKIDMIEMANLELSEQFTEDRKRDAKIEALRKQNAPKRGR
jgi:hypothetical protein